MKIAVRLARNRRLLAWCAVSLFLHLLIISLVDTSAVFPSATGNGSPVAIRLARTPSPATHAVRQDPPQLAQAAQAVPPDAPLPPQAPTATAASPQPLPPQSIPARDAAPPAVPTPGTTGEPPPDAVPVAAEDNTPPLAPIFHQTSPPSSARLSYVVTRTRPAGTAETGTAAKLVWEMSGNEYRLQLDGVLGAYESEGGMDDVGLAPRSISEHGPAGSTHTARFNRETRRIETLTGGAALLLGTQDTASLLMHLAGMGRSNPDQFNNTFKVVVGGTGGVRVVSFQQVGREELETGAGRLTTVHLEQLVQTGERRLEIWLAPERDWMPVQIRVTEPDGTVANQLASSIDTMPSP